MDQKRALIRSGMGTYSRSLGQGPPYLDSLQISRTHMIGSMLLSSHV